MRARRALAAALTAAALATGPAPAAGAARAAGAPGPGPVAEPPLRAAATEVRCGQRSLPACTRDRVAALQKLAATLRRAAVQRPAKPPADPRAREELARYDVWLVEQSERAAKLVMEGERALAAGREAPAAQMSFNLQYLQLQSRMQHENRSYTAISNIMKTKHDTVKNSISNIR
jgi:hypothetical protein